MRKMLLAGAAVLAVVLWLPRAAEANCGHCDKDKVRACICQIEGVEKAVANTAAGVTVTFTAKDPAVVKKLQEAAANMKDCACGKCTGKAGCKCSKCAKKGKCTGKPDCKCPHCARKGGKK
jgi:hypothetical protein